MQVIFEKVISSFSNNSRITTMIAKVALIAALVAVAHAGVLNAGYGYAAAPALAYGGLGVRAAVPAYGGLGYGGLGYAAASPVYAKAAIAAPVVAKAIVEAPQPYEFGYSHHTDDGAASSRQESSDANNAKHGSYSIQNPDGTYRHVEYVADAAGFRATIKTNEHGTAPQPAAATQILAEEPPYKVLPAPAPIVKAVHAAPVIAKAGLGYAGLGYAAATPVIAKAGLGYGGLGYAAAAPAYGLGLRAGYGYGAAGLVHG